MVSSPYLPHAKEFPMIRVLGPTPWILPLFTGFMAEPSGQASDNSLAVRAEPPVEARHHLPGNPFRLG